ncbi:hypothetical protein [Streptococcus suis]|uniref:hypothetical protein n=1 Tax=Streptococcus suis TaxID=1307 RepID=UPI00240F24C3|nr:hypothetical protein [Streptococcus suis]MDG3136233.1 hypothetical protein [Streptococcus suis]
MRYIRKTILGKHKGKKQFARPLRHRDDDFLREYLGIGKDDCIPILLGSDRLGPTVQQQNAFAHKQIIGYKGFARPRHQIDNKLVEKYHGYEFVEVMLNGIVEGEIFNPLAEIGKLDFYEAKRIMLLVYGHNLSEEEYPLLLTAGSIVDFFENL